MLGSAWSFSQESPQPAVTGTSADTSLPLTLQVTILGEPAPAPGQVVQGEQRSVHPQSVCHGTNKWRSGAQPVCLSSVPSSCLPSLPCSVHNGLFGIDRHSEGWQAALACHKLVSSSD